MYEGQNFELDLAPHMQLWTCSYVVLSSAFMYHWEGWEHPPLSIQQSNKHGSRM